MGQFPFLTNDTSVKHHKFLSRGQQRTYFKVTALLGLYMREGLELGTAVSAGMTIAASAASSAKAA